MELDPNDDLYQQFINSFQQSDFDRLFADDDDDDANDQDYNVYQDIENIDDFKEFFDFFDETNNNNKDNDDDRNETINSNSYSSDNLKSNDNNGQHSFSNDQLLILYHQLSFHTQSLTQNWLLSIRYDENIDDPDDKLQKNYENMLEELDELSAKNDTNIFKLVKNLSPSIQLIKNKSDRLIEKEKKSKFDTVLSSHLKSYMIENRQMFPYEWALPSRPFICNKNKFKNIFTEPDDHLIAFGMQKFFRGNRRSTRNNCIFKYIHENFLPNHSIRSIRDHVRFLRRSIKIEDDAKKYEKWKDNPIIYYFRENKLPIFKRYFTRENLSITDQLHPLPSWYQKYSYKDDNLNPRLCIDDSKKNNDSNRSDDQKSNHLSTNREYRRIMPKFDSENNSSLYGLCGPRIMLSDGTIIQNIIANPNFPSFNYSKFRRKRKYNRNNILPSSSNSNDNDSSMNTKPSNIDENMDVSEVQMIENDKNDCAINVDDPNKQAKREMEVENIEIDMNEYENVVVADEEVVVDDDDTGEIDDDDDDDDNVDNNDDDEDEVDVEDEESSMIMNMDDEEDLMALMVASWTTVANQQNGKSQQQTQQDDVGRINRRKSELLALQQESSKYILKHSSSNSSSPIDLINDRLISYYLKRSRKLLINDDDYVQFLEMISNSNEHFESSEKIYDELYEFLLKIRSKYIEKYSDDLNEREKMIEGFDELIELLPLLTLFSHDEFSNYIHKNHRLAFDYLHWMRIFKFFHKVELYLKFVYDGRPNQQQNCLQKIIRLLNQFWSQQKQQNNQITNEQLSKIKVSISKILHNHPLLTKEFSALFLQDSPFDSNICLQNEDFDEFIITNDDHNDEFVITENCTIPIDANDLKYGTNECPCSECHNQMTDDSSVLINNNHCAMCSIRFISGRIYLPQISTNYKRLQLVEHVLADDKIESNNNNINNVDQVEQTKIAWTLEEDRQLLLTCRSIIVDCNITKFSEQIINKLAMKLMNENFLNTKRTINDVAERLKHLIDILTG